MRSMCELADPTSQLGQIIVIDVRLAIGKLKLLFSTVAFVFVLVSRTLQRNSCSGSPWRGGWSGKRYRFLGVERFVLHDWCIATCGRRQTRHVPKIARESNHGNNELNGARESEQLMDLIISAKHRATKEASRFAKSFRQVISLNFFDVTLTYSLVSPTFSCLEGCFANKTCRWLDWSSPKLPDKMMPDFSCKRHENDSSFLNINLMHLQPI